MKAQNRKEIFLKALANGEEPNIKPLTREEELLAKQAKRESESTGGGTPHWNDIEGKPFEEFLDHITIIDGTFDFAANTPMTDLVDASKLMELEMLVYEAGIDLYSLTYTVLWDGEVFECQVNDGVIGNFSLLEPSMPDTGEPFVITGFEMCMTPNEGRHTLVVSTSFNNIKRLDKKFLPSNAVIRDPETNKIPCYDLPAFYILISRQSDGTYKANKTYAEIKTIAAESSGKYFTALVDANLAYPFRIPFVTTDAGKFWFAGYAFNPHGFYDAVTVSIDSNEKVTVTKGNFLNIALRLNGVFTMFSPNGTKYQITVSDEGVVSATKAD